MRDSLILGGGGCPLSTTVYLYSYHSNDQVTWRLVSGVMYFLGPPL